MNSYYQVVFPNPGDGTAFSASDMMEMEEFWHQIAEMERAGVLRLVTIDEEAAMKELLNPHPMMPNLWLANILDAAIGEGNDEG